MWVHLRSQWRLGLSLGTLLLGAAAAHANPITLVSQTRRVQAIAVCGTEQDPQSFEATNFDPFDEVASSHVAEVPPFQPGCNVPSGAQASQTSTLTSLLLQSSGNASTNISGNGVAQAKSIFIVEFSLAEAQAYSATGDLETTASTVLVELRYLDDDIIIFTHGGSTLPVNFDIDEDGLLEAGNYRLTATVENLSVQLGGSYSINLLVPEPGTGVLLLIGLAGLAVQRRSA